MAALRFLSDDAGFYARAAIAWLLSACRAAAILRGWIRGQGFRARTVHLATLFYSTWLSRDALRLQLAHGILPESRLQCRGPVVVGVLSIGEHILMDNKAYFIVLLWVAAICLFAGLAVGAAAGSAVAIWGKTMPAAAPAVRPTVIVPGRKGGPGGIGGTILVEILLFIPCILSCFHSLPIMVLEYMAAAANCGDAAAA